MRPGFNIAGPCIPGEHYMLPPERRLGRVMELVEDHRYFTLHAGRQVGKTTSARWMMRHYNASGRFRAVWVDLQSAREQPDPAPAFRTVLGAFQHALTIYLPALTLPSKMEVEELLDDPSRAIHGYLRRLAETPGPPLLLFLDEADGLVGTTMVSFLTQLREGYIGRAESPFPASIVLIGQRQVRDYTLRQEDRRTLSWLGTASPFNITAEATTLVPFTEAEVAELLAQHTTATGQPFEPDAVARIYALGCGHPWLTNALADQIVGSDLRDRGLPVTVEHVEAAKETIIQERRSHIDSLVARLHEDRVRRVLDPMIAGERPNTDLLDDDLQYLLGLGLLVRRGSGVEIANPIYREVIPRVLNWAIQVTLPPTTARYIRPDGSLDMGVLMTAFQQFWRKDGHLAAEGFHYRESGPHLLMMAFLQRLVNGGGRIDREYGLGRGALDLLVTWKGERHAIELKLRRDTETEEEGLLQLAGDLDTAGLDEGWLILFDLRSTAPWSERIFQRKVEVEGRVVQVIGC